MATRLGVLDWGIGGLGFLRLLKKRHPGVRVIYLSDSGEVPYGCLPSSALADRIARALTFLQEYGADHVVVACNAASTVLPQIAGRVLRGTGEPVVSRFPRHTGVIHHGIESVVAQAGSTPGASVGVIGGERTIRSGIYRRALEERGFIVRQRVAQPLSAHIERGDVGSPELDRDLRRIVAPLCGIDHLLLACTHYAAILPAIAQLLPGTTIIDPISRLLYSIEQDWVLPRSSIDDLYLTTGDPAAMKLSAERAFGIAIEKVERVNCDLVGQQPSPAIRETKAFVYVVRTDRPCAQLLVFETHDEPWGYEVPRGRIEPGETPRDGALRELFEESGLVADASRTDHIGTTLWMDQEQHFYLCMAPDGIPEEFSHCITGGGGDAGWVYRYRWLDVDERLCSMLVQGCGRFIAVLLEAMK